MSTPSSSDKPHHGSGSEALRDAAITLAAEDGIDNLTIRAVAERAGVSHGLVRHHFGSREGLIETVAQQAAHKTLYLESGPGGDPLSTRIDSTLGELRIQYDVMLSSRGNPRFSSTVATAYRSYEEEIVRWLKANPRVSSGNVDAATVLLVCAVLDGLAIQRLALGDSVDVDAALARLTQLLEES